jgi:uncharacterized membrane protein YdjX (TVP38/TMEM64 family)
MARKFLILMGGVLCILVILITTYWTLLQIGGDDFRLWLENFWAHTKDTLSSNGPFLFLSIAVLPGLILPVAPLLGLAGLWGGENGPWLSCFYCSLALFANLSWTYWLARGPARGLLKKLLGKSRFRLPESPPDNMIEWALILRLTPGVPFIFTNYGLGLVGMKFHTYLAVSLPILSFTACGYVLAFAGFFGGEWKYLWSGACIIAVTLLLGRFALKRKRNHAN